MRWLKRIFGKTESTGDTTQKSKPGLMCSQCMGGYDASCVVIMPWWNDSMNGFTTTYRCLLCLPESIEESRLAVSDWNDDIRLQLCKFLQRHQQDALADILAQCEPDEAKRHFDDFLGAIENWQIRLRPSVVPSEVGEASKLVSISNNEWTELDSVFMSAPKHLGPIEDKAEASPETVQMTMRMSSQFWEDGERDTAIGLLETLRSFQRKRRRLYKEETFPVLVGLGTAYRTLDRHQEAAQVLFEAGHSSQHPLIKDGDRFSALVKSAGSYFRIAEDAKAREALIAASPIVTRLLPVKNAEFAGDLTSYLMCCGALGDVPNAFEIATRVSQAQPSRSIESSVWQMLMTGAQFVLNPPRRTLPIDKAQTQYETNCKSAGRFAPSSLESLFLLLQELLLRKQVARAVATLDAHLQEMPDDLSSDLFPGLKSIANLIAKSSAQHADLIYAKILQRATELYGLEHIETATLMAELSGVFLQSEHEGSATAALGLLKHAVPILEEQASESEATLAAQNNLAMAYMNTGQIPECIELFRSIIPRFHARHGESHPATLGLLASYARALEFHGELDAACEQFEAVCKSRDKVLGPNHPDSIRSWANLGSVELKRGNLDAAVDFLTKSMAFDMKTNGFESEASIPTMATLSVAHFKQGKPEDAVQLAEIVLQRSLASAGASLESMKTAISNLVDFQVDEADHAGFVKKLIEVRNEHLSKGDVDVGQWLRIVNSMAVERTQCGRHGTAIEILRYLLIQTEEHFGHDTNPVVFVGGNLAMLLIQQDQAEEAIVLLEDLCQRGSKLGFEDRLNYISIRQKLAAAYLGVFENEKARVLLQSLYDEFRAMDQSGLDGLADFERILLDSLAKAYMRCNDVTNAAATFEQVLPMHVEQLGKSNEDTVLTAAYLAQIYAVMGDRQRRDELIGEFGLETYQEQ